MTVKNDISNKNYDEAMQLLIEARMYISRNRFNMKMIEDPVDRLIYCRETTRLTTRLTHIMGWLLTQKAVDNGEITWYEAMTSYQALKNERICTEEMEEDTKLIPDQLKKLLSKSSEMYQRISRLDDLVRRNLNVV